MSDIANIVINNGVAVGMLLYFIYRDNKFIMAINEQLKELTHSIDLLNKRLDKIR